MTINRELGQMLFSLAFGVLLMTFPGPSFDASNSDTKEEHLLTDFTSDSTDLGWYVQNDNVMGGRSKGDFQQTGGVLIFAGSTNTNGGGFSSIRTQPLHLDLSSYRGIRLRVKGDGRRYTWQLQTNALWRGRRISYWADFETSSAEWNTVNIPFLSFAPRFRGLLLDGPQLDPKQITEMGLYIYDKQDGPFEIHLDGVYTYPAEVLSR